MKILIANRGVRLFIILGGFFVANALVAEFIGVKIFALEETLGWKSFNWNLFGESGSLMFSAGVLLWPIVFIFTDIINEYYGRRGVKLLSYSAAIFIAYAFLMIYFAMSLAPADFWVTIGAEQGIPDMNAAFSSVYGQSNWIIVGSLIAFLLGQLLDAWIFFMIRKFMGDKMIWLRATVSTLVSQFIDSFVVLYIAFVLGPQNWPINRFLAIGTVNYSYKVIAAIALIPLLYFVRFLIDRYLGKELSERLRKEAVSK